MDNIIFGDWIEVAGKHPWWLRNGEPYQVGGELPVFYSRTDPDYYWGGTTRIRVRADHPYYTAKPSTSSNEELTQRMVVEGDTLTMLRSVLAYVAEWDSPVSDEARQLLSDLPKPVDPDLIEARRICEEVVRCGQYMCGRNDRSDEMQIALEAIKLGRTLAAGGTAHE